mmetsp:Transcript_31741/g.69356  ORF Transcript_31741/g.69356 Transcript_31741/m.69356 type:complete len:231 (+) Transcript_31741:118-810(+)
MATPLNDKDLQRLSEIGSASTRSPQSDGHHSDLASRDGRETNVCSPCGAQQLRKAASTGGIPDNLEYSVAELCRAREEEASLKKSAKITQITPRAPPKQSGLGAWRARKYVAPQSTDAIVSGSLQRQVYGLFWLTRWVVLRPNALSIYLDEAHFRRSPNTPLDSLEVEHLAAFPETNLSGYPGAFRCFDLRNPRHARVILRSGATGRWEELASAHLWVDFINSATQVTCP